MKVIFNAELVDENLCEPGIVVTDSVDGKEKIISVLKGNFSSTAAAAEALQKASVDPSNAEYVDAKGLTVTPAFIDMHAHFRYPGQTQKEDLDSALKAAAAGGFGTLVLMPNTNPVVSSKELALKINSEAADRKLSTVFQSVSITQGFQGTDTSHLDNLDCKEIPVITEDGHDVDSAYIMLEGMKKAAKNHQIVSCHSEDISLSLKAKEYRTKALTLMKEFNIPAWGVKDSSVLKDVPSDKLSEIKENITQANHLLELAEDTATERNILIAQKASCHVHIAHVSTIKSIDAVRKAKASLPADSSFKISCEVTPHHLSLTGTDEPKIFAFVNPPLRSEADRKALIQALRDGTADVISTDHAPHTADDKAAGSPGFTGLETAYGVCNSILVKEEGFSKSRLSALMASNPARLLGLKKGLLCSGYDADLVFADPDEKWIVDSSKFMSKGKATPIDGDTLTGRVHAIMLDGQIKAGSL